MPRISVVRASAGSGKTFALSKRYIELALSDDGVPENETLKKILAVTFTNNAAVQMKSRIIEYLKSIALDCFAKKILKQTLTADMALKGEAAAKKAGRVIDAIMRRYDDLQVKTIDSFINSLLAGSSFRLGLSSGFRIEDIYRDHLEYGFNSLMDEASSDKGLKGVLGEFLKQYIYVENREGWMPSGDMLAIVSAMFSIKNAHGGSFRASGVTNRQIIERKRKITGLARKLLQGAPEGTNGTFIKSLTAFAGSEDGLFDMDGLSRYFIDEKYPVNKGVVTPGEIARLWRSIKQELSGLALWEATSRFDCYLAVFEMAEERVKAIAAKENVVFLEELNRKARGLFAEAGMTVGEAYCRLAARYMNYLIDEFQDTSVLQWKNIFPMLEEALSAGGRLFSVGDAKQAIYRFRGGDISLLGRIGTAFGGVECEKKDLQTNYRSRKAIVEFNNRVFSRDNLSRFLEANSGEFVKIGRILEPGGAAEILDVYKSAEQKCHRIEDGYVKLEFVDRDDSLEPGEEMRGRVIAAIKDLSGRMRPSETAVLTRSNRESWTVTGWLLDEGIPVQSDKTLDVREHFIVKELMALLGFLDSPVDDIKFAAFIMGDVFCRAAGMSADTAREFIFKSSYGGRKSPLYKVFRKEYGDIWNAFISEYFKKAGIVPLYEFMVSILGKYGVIEHFPCEQAFIMKFLELIKSREDKYSGIGDFMAFLSRAPAKDIYVTVQDPHAVQVLTIHQSKGLEFGAVILPFLAMEVKVGGGGAPSRRGRDAQYRRPFVVNAVRDDIQLLYLRQCYAVYSEDARLAYRQEYEKAMIDELNVAYVALTRARDELYVFVPAKSGKRDNIMRSLLPGPAFEAGAKTRPDVKLSGEHGNVIKIPPAPQSDWISLIKEEFVEDSALMNRDSIASGDIYHSIFSFIGDLTGKDADKELEKAAHKTEALFPLAGDIGQYVKAVKKVITSKSLEKFFYCGGAAVMTEMDIVDRNGRTKRIDRMIVARDSVMIMDYKSSKPASEDEKYSKQVAEYMGLAKEVYPGKKVSGYLLYIDEAKAEEV